MIPVLVLFYSVINMISVKGEWSMSYNQKLSGRAWSMSAGIAAGCTISFGLTLGGAWGLAYLLSEEILQWENAGYGVMIILFLASIAGAFTAKSKIKRLGFWISQITGGFYFIGLMAITALFFGGQYEAVGVTALLVWGGSTIAGLPIQERKTKLRHKKKKSQLLR